MRIETKWARADAARREAFDRILANHMLYCTVCDNNNGNCVIHNPTKMLEVEPQKIPFQPKPYEVDATNPFYQYDPDQCLLCGRCVEACPDVDVNETLSLKWEEPNLPRLLGRGAARAETLPLSLRSCLIPLPLAQPCMQPMHRASS